MRIKRFLAMVCIFSMMSGFFVFPAKAEQATSLSDVPETHWGYESILRWIDAEVLNGYPSNDGKIAFRPSNSMTRGEFAKVVATTLGLSRKGDNHFQDLSDNAWYTPYILLCNGAGIMKGDTDGCVHPESSITRQEAFAMLARSLKLENGTQEDLKGFADGSQVSGWAVPETAAVVNYRAVAGNDKNELNPKSRITRAEVVKILDRIVAVHVNHKGTITVTSDSEIQRAGNFAVVSGGYIQPVPYEYTKGEDGSDQIAVTAGEQSGRITVSNGKRPVVISVLRANPVIPDANASGTLVPPALVQVHLPEQVITTNDMLDHTYSEDKTLYIYGTDMKLDRVENWANGKLLVTYTAEFDQQGHCTALLKNGKCFRKYQYINGKNCVTERYDQSGELDTSYQYNDEGERIECREYSDGKLIEIQKAVIQGNKKVISFYDADGNLLDQTLTYIINDHGDPVEMTVKNSTEKIQILGEYENNLLTKSSMHRNDVCVSESFYSYDDQGRELEAHHYSLNTETGEVDLNTSNEKNIYDDEKRQVTEERYSSDELPKTVTVKRYDEYDNQVEESYKSYALGEADGKISSQYHTQFTYNHTEIPEDLQEYVQWYRLIEEGISLIW